MKRYFLAGLAILLPVALTAMIAVFLINYFTRPFIPVVRMLLESFALPEEAILLFSRIIALGLLFLFIVLLGIMARHFLFKGAAEIANYILLRIPLVKTIYKLSRDIFSALFSPEGRQAFKDAVTIPFPTPPYRAVGLSSGSAPAECEEKAGMKLTPVFSPTAPHPISGFLFLVPEEDVQKLNMTKEDAFKYLVSCGVIIPDSEKADE